MRALVCGGRDFADHMMMWRVLDDLHEQRRFSMLINGVARGADTIAAQWATYRKIPIYRFHAPWKTMGNAAGPIRNAKMLEKGKPELVIAFPGKHGTQDMMRKALAANVEVLKVRANGSVERWVYQGELNV